MRELVFATVIEEVRNAFRDEINDSELIKRLYNCVVEACCEEDDSKDESPKIATIDEVSKNTANRIVNREFGGNPLKEIKAHCQDSKVKLKIGKYIKKNITSYFVPDMKGEIIYRLSRVINEDTSISDNKRDELLSLGKKDSFDEFLGQVYLYSLTRDNEDKENKENRKKKTIDQSSKVALYIGILSFVGTILLGIAYIVSARTTAKSNAEIANSNIEAAKLVQLAETDTDRDLGISIYKERAIYQRIKANSTVLVRAFPYDNEDNILENSDAKRFTIEAAISNIKDHTWYRLASDVHQYPESPSGQAYIYNVRLEFVEDAAIIKWEWGDKNIKSKPFHLGHPISFKGSICSTNRMTKITAELKKTGIIQGDSISIPLDNEYSFSMEDSKIDVFPFEDLPTGDDYQLVLTIDYLSNGGKNHCTKTIIYDFDIVNTVIHVPAFDTVDSLDCLYQGDGQQHEVRRYPHDDQVDENILEKYTTKRFSIIDVIKNEYDEIWYLLDSEVHPYGCDAYIYSGDVQIVVP